MTELATFTPYGAPYWWKRAWSPKGRDAWERKALVALELGDVQGLEKLLTRRERSQRWREQYGKTRAFALDFTADIIAGKRLIRLALTPQRLFEEWRAKAARDTENWDVEREWHDDQLAAWEGQQMYDAYPDVYGRPGALQETAVRTP